MKSWRHQVRSLKIFLSIAGFSVWMACGSAGTAQTVCGRIEVRAAVEVAGDELSLADFLAPGSCPAVVRGAIQVHMGRPPRGTSVRVVAGDEIRDRIEQLARNEKLEQKLVRNEDVSGGENAPGQDAITVPERITVRRAGMRVSCAELAGTILRPAETAAASSASRPASPMSKGNPRPAPERADEIECGSMGTIPQGAGIEVVRTNWDPSRRSWETRARCRRTEDCVPFFIRWQGDASESETPLGLQLGAAAWSRAAAGQERDLPLVRPGRKATLLWEQDGIRVVVPAISLDSGRVGDTVRVRLVSGGRVLRAIVVSAGVLRVAS